MEIILCLILEERHIAFFKFLHVSDCHRRTKASQVHYELHCGT